MQQMTVKEQIDRELDVLTVDKQKKVLDFSLFKGFGHSPGGSR